MHLNIGVPETFFAIEYREEAVVVVIVTHDVDQNLRKSFKIILKVIGTMLKNEKL